jgi:hypothetical protein
LNFCRARDTILAGCSAALSTKPPWFALSSSTAALVYSAPPNAIVDAVEQRTGDKRFERLEDVISQDELRAIFERYQKVAGYHVEQAEREKLPSS